MAMTTSATKIPSSTVPNGKLNGCVFEAWGGFAGCGTDTVPVLGGEEGPLKWGTQRGPPK
jgi:hypothetical protein